MTPPSPLKPRVPKYVRLAESIREQVRSGALKPGDQLPSYAQVQAQFGIGQGTLERVYMLLEQENLIVRTPKLGTFVAEPRRRDRTNVIGVTFGVDPHSHPYYTKLLQGIQDVAREHQIELLLLHKTSTLNWDKMDGLIGGFESLSPPPAMPAVLLLNSHPGIPSVVSNDYDAITMAMEHLLGLGHRRIAYLLMARPDEVANFSPPRLRAYRDSLQAAGIAGDMSWIRRLHSPWTGTSQYTDLGYEKMKMWLEEGWESLGCTALLAQNDETAIGALHALHDAGMDVPGQVSVIGFDGLEIAEHTRPALATLVVPLREIGATAARYLLQRIDGSSLDTSLCPDEALIACLPTTWRQGESTGKPREAD